MDSRYQDMLEKLAVDREKLAKENDRLANNVQARELALAKSMADLSEHATALNNVAQALDVYERVKSYGDESFTKQAFSLLKDATRRARASYKAAKDATGQDTEAE